MAYKVRTEINILDELISAASGSSATSNARARLVPDNFNGTATGAGAIITTSFYFEVVAYVSSGTLSTSISLRRSGTATDDATITQTLTTTPTLYRSSSFSQTSTTDYTVFINTASGATKNVKSARIIVIQEFATAPPSTESQFEIGAAQSSITSVTAVALNAPKYWKYTASAYSPTPSFYLDVTWNSPSTKVTASCYLQVADGTGDGFVGWSNVATYTSTASWHLDRFGPFTPTDGRNYRVAFSTSNSKSAISVANARIVAVYANTSYGDFSKIGSGDSWASTYCACGLSDTRVARYWYDGSQYSLTTYDWNSGTNSWDKVGNDYHFTAYGLSAADAITAMSSSRVAMARYVVGSGHFYFGTYDFDGTDWALVGNEVDLGTGINQNLQMLAMSATRIAVHNNWNSWLRVYDFDGTNWSSVGSDGSYNANYLICPLNSSQVAAFYAVDKKLYCLGFDGSSWAQVGNASAQLFTTVTSFITPARMSDTTIAYLDGTNDLLQQWEFDGTNWAQVGTDFPLSNTGGFLVGLANIGGTATAIGFYASSTFSRYQANATGFTNSVKEYLFAPYTPAAGTSLQTFLTEWDTAEWDGVSQAIVAVTDAANGSTSVTEIDTAGGTQVSGSVVTSPDNQGFSSAVTMPSNGNLDCTVTTNNGDIYAIRLVFSLSPAAPPLTISVSDSSTATESVTVIAGAFFQFQTCSVTESVSLVVSTPIISAIESITVAESANLVKTSIGEFLVVDFGEVVENVALAFKATLSVNDSVSRTDVTSLIEILQPKINDAATVTESVTLAFTRYISVFDATAQNKYLDTAELIPSPLKASLKLRQEINVLDSLLSAASGAEVESGYAVDCSSLAALDANAPVSSFPYYSGNVKVYLEVVAYASAPITCSIGMLQTNGSSVFGGITADLTTTPTLYRSPNWNLGPSIYFPTAPNTDLHLWISGASGATKYVKAARIIILQDNVDTLTETETSIEIGGEQTFTSTSFAPLSASKYWKYTASEWDAGPSAEPTIFFWDASMSTSTSKTTATAELQVADGTGDGFVGWSAVNDLTVVSPGSAYLSKSVGGDLSGAFTPIDGRNYRVVFKSSSNTNSITSFGAHIRVRQTAGHFRRFIYTPFDAFHNATGPGGLYIDALTRICRLSATRVAVVVLIDDDFTSTYVHTLQAYDLSGGYWSPVGNALTLSDTEISPHIAALSSTSIAYCDGYVTPNVLRKYNFNGTNWTQDGSDINPSANGEGEIAVLSSTRIAVNLGGSFVAYDWNGSQWAQVGNSYNPHSDFGASISSIATLTSSRIALFCDLYVDGDYPSYVTHPPQLATIEFDGTNWAVVGNILQLGTVTTQPDPSDIWISGQMSPVDSSRVVITQGIWALEYDVPSYALVFSFDGTDWAPVGSKYDSPSLLGVGETSTYMYLMNCTYLGTSGDTLNFVFNVYWWGSGLYLQNATYIDLDTEPITALAPQYLLASYLLPAGTSLQGFLTEWDTNDWSALTFAPKVAIDAANDSASDVEIDTFGGTQLSGSTVTNPDNQGFSALVSMPTGPVPIDCKATTNNNDIYAVRIVFAITPGLAIYAWDNVAHTESITLVVGGVVVSDAASVAESVSLTFNPKLVSVNDSATVADVIQPSVTPKLVSVSDATAATTENVALTFNPKLLSLFDAATITENVSFTLISTGQVNVTETVTVVENLSVATLALKLSVFDTATVSEVTSFTYTIVRLVFDSATVAENRAFSGTSYRSVSDTGSVTESVSFTLFTAIITIFVFDDCTTTESLGRAATIDVGPPPPIVPWVSDIGYPIATWNLDYKSIWLSERLSGVPGSGIWTDAKRIYNGEIYDVSTGALWKPNGLTDPWGMVGSSPSDPSGEGSHVYFVDNGVIQNYVHFAEETPDAYYVNMEFWFTTTDGAYSYQNNLYLPVATPTDLFMLRSTDGGITWSLQDPENSPTVVGSPYAPDPTRGITQRVGELLYFFYQRGNYYSPPEYAIWTFNMRTKSWSLPFAIFDDVDDVLGSYDFDKRPTRGLTNGLFPFPNGDIGLLMNGGALDSALYMLWTKVGELWGSPVYLPDVPLGSPSFVNAVIDPNLEKMHVLLRSTGFDDPISNPYDTSYCTVTHAGEVSEIISTLSAPENYPSAPVGKPTIYKGMILVPFANSVAASPDVWVAYLNGVFQKEVLPAAYSANASSALFGAAMLSGGYVFRKGFYNRANTVSRYGFSVHTQGG